MTEGDQVELIIGKESPLGYAVLIDETSEGLLYKNEIFQEISEGMHLVGYIKKIREDGKIDVSLTPQGFRNNIDQLVELVLKKLEQSNGILPLTDKSSPEAIKRELKMSKKNFKKAIGALYKQRKIQINTEDIRIIKKG